MRKKYFTFTFESNPNYSGYYTKIASKNMEEARGKILSITSSYSRIFSNMIFNGVKEHSLKYIPLGQIKEEALDGDPEHKDEIDH